MNSTSDLHQRVNLFACVSLSRKNISCNWWQNAWKPPMNHISWWWNATTRCELGKSHGKVFWCEICDWWSLFVSATSLRFWRVKKSLQPMWRLVKYDDLGFCLWCFRDYTMVSHHEQPPFGKICVGHFLKASNKQIQVKPFTPPPKKCWYICQTIPGSYGMLLFQQSWFRIGVVAIKSFNLNYKNIIFPIWTLILCRKDVLKCVPWLCPLNSR